MLVDLFSSVSLRSDVLPVCRSGSGHLYGTLHSSCGCSSCSFYFFSLWLLAAGGFLCCSFAVLHVACMVEILEAALYVGLYIATQS